MFFGVDYYPEYSVVPSGGDDERLETAWEEAWQRDAAQMAQAGFNVVRIGEFSWGICEPQEGQYDFDWLRRVMDIMGEHGLQVVLGTPTAAPPIWLARKYPEILPIDERGLLKHEGTRRAVCLSSDVFWDYSKRIVTAMAQALGDHPQLIAWQIDNSIGGNNTEFSYNPATLEEWHLWLEAKYKTVDRLNELLGLRVWGQTVSSFDEIPMPRRSPAPHNPALLLDWNRFSSDTMVQFVKMQAEILHELCSQPVTVTMRAFFRNYDHFDMAEAVDFVSIESNVPLKSKVSELACDIDMIRSLKKSDINTPDGDYGFWAMEQKVGQSDSQEIKSAVRPGIIRLFTYQMIARGASGVLYFRWQQPRIGPEKFNSAIVRHQGDNSRTLKDITQLGEEIKLLAPAIKNTKVVADVCILYTHDNEWSLQQSIQPSKHFNLRFTTGISRWTFRGPLTGWANTKSSSRRRCNY
jgi:beta-galactosidase